MKLDKPDKEKNCAVYISVLLINQSPNVELKPGPVASHFPCGYCKMEVTWSLKGHREVTWSHTEIFCEEVGIWYHNDCQCIGDGTYDILSESN